MYLIKTPQFIQNLFPNFTWKMETEEKAVYLTFDDGPIPEVTPWVLSVLKEYQAKATFFCVGENVQKHPDVYKMVLKDGHSVGNHTYNHVNGWKAEPDEYLFNVSRCSNVVPTALFRPPYGRLKPKQATPLLKHYNIIMWDVLSGDFDNRATAEDCYGNVMRNVEPGSIVVMHDSIKAEPRLKGMLPRLLETLSKDGYVFKNIPDARELRAAARA